MSFLICGRSNSQDDMPYNLSPLTYPRSTRHGQKMPRLDHVSLSRQLLISTRRSSYAAPEAVKPISNHQWHSAKAGETELANRRKLKSNRQGTYWARPISCMDWASMTTMALVLRSASSAIVNNTPSSSAVELGLATKTGSEGMWFVAGVQTLVFRVCVSILMMESAK